MDKKSKFFLVVLLVAILVSFGYTLYKSVILKDIEFINTDNSDTEEAAETI